MRMEPVDTDVLACELVRALRAGRSREAFARRVGVSASAVYAWETGRRAPSADLLFRAAARLGVDVPAALRGFLGAAPAWLEQVGPEDPSFPGRLVDALRGDGRVAAFAAHLGVPRFAISRWTGGSAVPRLSALLAATTFGAWRLVDFVALFTDPEELPALARVTAQLRAARRVIAGHPWAGAILTALEAGGTAPLSERIGVPPEEAALCLPLLHEAGLVRPVGEGWELVRGPPVELRTPAARRAARSWGAHIAAERIEHGAPGLYNFTLFTASAADRERLEGLHRAYVEALRAVALAPSGGECVLVANVHLFDLGHKPGP